MSRLDELIAELCPNGVIYKRFDEACTLHARIGWQRLTKGEHKVTGDYMLITGTDFTSSNEVNYKSCVYVSKDRYVQDPKIQIKDGDVLITKDGTLGKVAQVNNLPMPATLNGGVFVVRPKDESLLPRYVMHFLLSGHFQKVVEQQKTGSTISHLTQALFSRLLLPVPPLEVQREIVRILDSFTLLTAELTAELTARKKQYEFYRRELLTFDESIPQFQLRDIASFRNGKGHEKNIANNGKYIVINSKFISTNGQIVKNSDEQLSPLYTDDIAMVMSDLPNGRALAKCYLIDTDDKFTLNQRIGGFHTLDENKVVTKYLFYILDRNWQLLKYDNGVDQTNLKKDDILNISIPVPAIDVQKRLVYVLDNFEAICTDLNIGLPAEIEARQKQYEYYRDKLLSFQVKSYD